MDLNLRKGNKSFCLKYSYILLIRILIDGEKSFSENNINSLKVNDLKAVRIWPASGRKAYKAERAIRTVFS